MRRRLFTVSFVVLASVAVAARPASAANTVTATTAGFTFAPPVVSILPGDHLQLHNADVAPHNLTATDGSFRTTDVAPGATGAVEGVELLPAGDHPFYCSLHVWMRGTLHVGDAETPATPVPGFSSLPVGGAVVTPTSLTTFNGSMFVASYATGVVSQLPILPGGLLGPAQPYASGFTDPLGIAFDDATGRMYVSDSHPGASGATVGRVWAVEPGGAPATVLVDDLPNGRHNTNGLAVHNGQLFITNGSATDDGTPEGADVPQRSGTLLSVPLSGGDLTLHAKGMRNIYDVAFRPGTDEAWMPMNGPDMFDPYGEDLLLKADVSASTPDNFGFPACLYGSSVTDVQQNKNVSVSCDGTQKPPEQVLGLHVSADGITFDANHAFVYIAEFGNFFGNSVVGHKVVRVPVDANGVSGPPEDVIVGGLPLDVTATADGIYVADFGTGQITLVKPLA